MVMVEGGTRLATNNVDSNSNNINVPTHMYVLECELAKECVEIYF